jgi:phosphoribosyl 1,2-cyclic phosphate phosphodiesterase
MTGTLTFLGTGTSQGIPMPVCRCSVCQSDNPKDKRLRSSVLIQIQGKTFCIDSGPDFRYQMLREKVSALDAIIYTHEHRDHIAGLDDVRAFNYLQQKRMPLYAPREVVLALQESFSYIFKGNYPGIPQVEVIEIQEDPFSVLSIPFIPIPAMHQNLRVFGYRIGNLAYLTDAKTVPEPSRTLLKGLDTLVINCLHESPHPSHFNLEEALVFIEAIQPKKTYLTHLSHLFGKHEDIVTKLPSNVLPAYDGLKLPFNLLNATR